MDNWMNDHDVMEAVDKMEAGEKQWIVVDRDNNIWSNKLTLHKAWGRVEMLGKCGIATDVRKSIGGTHA